MNDPEASTDTGRARHWDRVYGTKDADGVSWYQTHPTVSLALIDKVRPRRDAPILDVGGGTSVLVDQLLRRGYTDLTVLDVSAHALELSQQRLREFAGRVHWEHADVLTWTPARRFALWHDRAVFHFLTKPAERATYRELATTSVTPGGHLIVGTFASDGPTSCSGLPVARYDPDALAEELGPMFTPVASRREHHRTPAGVDQPFTWLALLRAPTDR
ncbi:MAG: class I SAM-dependent methyltransferase [Pseudonocardia sp.]|nr:class I SAM-dependent methyltransferase [Pseudonocardia sp.]